MPPIKSRCSQSLKSTNNLPSRPRARSWSLTRTTSTVLSLLPVKLLSSTTGTPLPIIRKTTPSAWVPSRNVKESMLAPSMQTPSSRSASKLKIILKRGQSRSTTTSIYSWTLRTTRSSSLKWKSSLLTVQSAETRKLNSNFMSRNSQQSRESKISSLTIISLATLSIRKRRTSLKRTPVRTRTTTISK